MADNTTLASTSGGDVIADDDIGGVKYQRIKLVHGADGVNAGDVSTANGLPVALRDSEAGAISSTPSTFLRVSDEPRQVFYDPFDAALDTTNLWATPTILAPGVIAAVASGSMTMGTGATASGWSKLTSANTFRLPVPGWMGFSSVLSFSDLAAPNVNATRFWGQGSIPGTPTTAVPITDGVGFELSGAKMYAVVYAAGVRTAVQDLSAATGNSKQPTDTASHRYIVYIRTDKAYWYIDGLNQASLVATSNFQSPAVQTQGIAMVAVGNASNAANATIVNAGTAVWDTAKNATQLADGTYPWRKATINALGQLLGVAPATANVANSQVTATGSAATLLVARATRRYALIRNLDTTNSGYTGVATVTSANGMRIDPGESKRWDSTSLCQLIAPTGSPIFAVEDYYD